MILSTEMVLLLYDCPVISWPALVKIRWLDRLYCLCTASCFWFLSYILFRYARASSHFSNLFMYTCLSTDYGQYPQPQKYCACWSLESQSVILRINSRESVFSIPESLGSHSFCEPCVLLVCHMARQPRPFTTRIRSCSTVKCLNYYFI